MSERPTPETDAAERMAFAQEYMVPTAFARKLERERDQAREEVTRLDGAYEDATNYYARIIELKDERDEARNECKALWGMVDVEKKKTYTALRERDEARADRDIARLSAQDADKAHDRLARELTQALKERDEAREQANVMHEQWLSKGRCCENLAEELHEVKQQRDEAREKIKRQAERIRELEGATNHAGGLPKYHGTDETDAMVERWQSAHIPAGFARRMEFERNEALRKAEERLTQLTAITNSEPRDYMALVTACRVHKDHIAQLAKERDEAREALADWENAADHVEANHPDEVHCSCVPVLRKLLADARKERDEAIAECKALWSLVNANKLKAYKAERERDEAREELRQWQTLRLYGAEPEYIHEYIKRLRFDEVNNGNPTD